MMGNANGSNQAPPDRHTVIKCDSGPHRLLMCVSAVAVLSPAGSRAG